MDRRTLASNIVAMAKIAKLYSVPVVSVKGQRRVLLVMATGTGKTYTTFQIIWRLWKAREAKRILFLADRNIRQDLSTSLREA
jgi:type I site-specific restriction endonuclease